MKTLYAPWRSKYTSAINEGKKTDTPSQACVFCEQFNAHEDEKKFILKRYDHTVLMLNLYPYNAGHLLLLPYNHVASPDKLSTQERNELMQVTSSTIEIVNKALEPEGINVGINLGKAAGAGIPSHLHVHILPRWIGDTNFMPAIGETKVISFDLVQIYNDIKKHF